MEKKLFSWTDWNQFDTCGFIFHNITLKEKIKEYEAGTQFAVANVDYENGTLELFKEDETEPTVSVNITLQIT